MMLPILTLRQPWAAWVLEGRKAIETRPWRTNVRGPLLLHCGKSTSSLKALSDMLDEDGESKIDHLRENWIATWGQSGYVDGHRDQCGCLIAVMIITDCVPVDEIIVSDSERSMGDYTTGRYGLMIGAVVPLGRPMPMVGRLGIIERELNDSEILDTWRMASSIRPDGR